MQYKYIDVCFSLTLPLGLFLIMFSIISMDFFGLEAVESGYLMSYFGVLQMVSEVEDTHPHPRPLPHRYLNCCLLITCSSKSSCNTDRQILGPCYTWLQKAGATPNLFCSLEREEIRARSVLKDLFPVPLCRSLSCGARISLD